MIVGRVPLPSLDPHAVNNTITEPAMSRRRRTPPSYDEHSTNAVKGRGAERVTGIEPAFSAWEADVLPLNYTREGGTEVSVGS